MGFTGYQKISTPGIKVNLASRESKIQDCVLEAKVTFIPDLDKSRIQLDIYLILLKMSVIQIIYVSLYLEISLVQIMYDYI